MDKRIKQIRESEKKSHIEMYSSEELYKSDSWLKKPIKTVKELMPLFKEYERLAVLDLGCGVGRNSIFMAQEFRHIDCMVECVDYLDIAITKLNENASGYQLTSNIRGIVSTIEEYPISPNSYDLVLAVSALEHVESVEALIRKLHEIKNGMRKRGVVCLVMNSNVRETDKKTREPLPAKFEVNLPTGELQQIVAEVFDGWEVLKESVSSQKYDIPRESKISTLETEVVTYVARR